MIVKKITYFKGEGVFEMSRFTLPRDIYHGKGCLEELKNLKGKKAILVVGGGSMKRQGFLDRAENYLKEAGMEVKLFEGVEPDPSVETVMKGAAVMQEFQPDWIVAMAADLQSTQQRQCGSNTSIRTSPSRRCAKYSECRNFVRKLTSVQFLRHQERQRR